MIPGKKFFASFSTTRVTRNLLIFSILYSIIYLAAGYFFLTFKTGVYVIASMPFAVALVHVPFTLLALAYGAFGVLFYKKRDHFLMLMLSLVLFLGNQASIQTMVNLLPIFSTKILAWFPVSAALLTFILTLDAVFTEHVFHAKRMESARIFLQKIFTKNTL